MSINLRNLDEGVPPHVIARYAKGQEDIMTTYLVPKNPFDKIRADFSRYQAAKFSSDPYWSAFKCHVILLSILKQMQTDSDGRFEKHITNNGIAELISTYDNLIYGENAEDWEREIGTRFEATFARMKKYGEDELDEIKIDHPELAERFREAIEALEGGAWPLPFCPANLFSLQPLLKPTPGTVPEPEMKVPEGVLYILGDPSPVPPPIYAFALQGMTLLLTKDDLLYKLENFIYREAIERGFGRSQIEFIEELKKAPMDMNPFDPDGPMVRAYTLVSPYAVERVKRDQEIEAGTRKKEKHKKRRGKRQYKIADDRRTSISDEE